MSQLRKGTTNRNSSRSKTENPSHLSTDAIVTADQFLSQVLNRSPSTIVTDLRTFNQGTLRFSKFSREELLSPFRHQGAWSSEIRSASAADECIPDASPALRFLHERMPVILEPADWAEWLGEREGAPQRLLATSGARLRIWPVSTRVNNVRNDGPDLLEEAAPLP